MRSVKGGPSGGDAGSRMHAGARVAVRAAKPCGAIAGTAIELPVARGTNCSRAASFMATAILQQGARSMAVPLSSPAFTQQACEGEAQLSAARAGRAADDKRAVTAMTAATRRMGIILLGSCLRDNPKAPPRGVPGTSHA